MPAETARDSSDQQDRLRPKVIFVPVKLMSRQELCGAGLKVVVVSSRLCVQVSNYSTVLMMDCGWLTTNSAQVH